MKKLHNFKTGERRTWADKTSKKTDMYVTGVDVARGTVTLSSKPHKKAIKRPRRASKASKRK